MSAHQLLLAALEDTIQADEAILNKLEKSPHANRVQIEAMRIRIHLLARGAQMAAFCSAIDFDSFEMGVELLEAEARKQWEKVGRGVFLRRTLNQAVEIKGSSI